MVQMLDMTAMIKTRSIIKILKRFSISVVQDSGMQKCRRKRTDKSYKNKGVHKPTRVRVLERIRCPGKEKSFSTPPVSFQCISRFVGGAKSNVATISVVSESWDFISSPDMLFTSSTTSFLFRLAFTVLSAPTIGNKYIRMHKTYSGYQ